MYVAVIGCGYLGAVHAVCLASEGHTVIGLEIDEAKVRDLNAGAAPFFEPDLEPMLAEAVKSGRLKFTSDFSALDAWSDQPTVHFICVGTPQRVDSYAADLQYLDSAVELLRPHLKDGDLVVGKSTVPVGTARALSEKLGVSGAKVILAWNPEFLREGHAIADTLRPDRLVYGVEGGGSDAAVAMLDAVYEPALNDGVPRLVVDLPTAELVKTAANSFLATKISFINAMAELCEVAGGDVVSLADAIGMDERIGRSFLNAGVGFGGGCLPKDIRAFMARAGELGADQALSFLREVDSINARRRERVVQIVQEELGETLSGKKVAVLGAAFKPNSDDVRDSPALDVASRLAMMGADVTVTDPHALTNAGHKNPTLRYEPELEDAVEGAEAVLLLTEWQIYTALRPSELDNLVASRLIIDGRNVLKPEDWINGGWNYRALGRSSAR